MNLEQLLKETDSLTYINALKVTLMELKQEFSSIEEMNTYSTEACERGKKLIRKADNQYRVIAKLVQKDTPLISDLTIDSNMEDMTEMEKIMEGKDDE